MTTITSLSGAVAQLVHDGDTIALEGFTHLIPVAAGHEIIRQGRRDLTVVRMTPDIVYDQLIGAGCVRKMIFSWGGNPGVGSLYRFRDAVERGWPQPLEIEEHSHAGMANRYAAGAAGLPFAVLRGYRGTDLVDHTATLAPVVCPFTGEELTAVSAINPDVSIIHAQQADRSGNVMMWGITGVQKEAVLAARRAASTASFCTPVMPHSWTLPARSARWACTIVTSGFSAATAVRCSPVKGHCTVDTAGLYCGRSVPAEARSTAKGRPDAPAT